MGWEKREEALLCLRISEGRSDCRRVWFVVAPMTDLVSAAGSDARSSYRVHDTQN